MTAVNLGYLFIMIGLLTMVGTALNWRIVTHPGKLLNIILGDRTARVVYMVTGIALFVLGVGQVVGLNWLGG